jgi:hypothetical protein
VLKASQKRGYFSGMDYNVEISKDGYKTKIVELKTRTSNWYIFGNLFYGHVIGWLIFDRGSGAMWTFSDPKVSVDLKKMHANEAEEN